MKKYTMTIIIKSEYGETITRNYTHSFDWRSSSSQVVHSFIEDIDVIELYDLLDVARGIKRDKHLPKYIGV